MLGPPNNVTISNVTDTNLHIEWNPPDYIQDLVKYKIQAEVKFTYANKVLDVRSWEFSNETLNTELNSLQPGTVYNITVRGISSSQEGIAAFQTVEMKIGGCILM